MTVDLRTACLAMLREIRIESLDAVHLGNEEFRGVAHHVIPWLQGEIYKMFFCAMTSTRNPGPVSLFMTALSEANIGGVRWPKESFSDQPGSYLAFGPKEPPGTKWLRIYWNVTPLGATIVTASASAILNRALVPFRLKVLLDTSIRRRDAAVLYVPMIAWEAARPVVNEVAAKLRDTCDLQPETPLFAKTIAPGIGVAEDPHTGISFGLHRSWLVARSLVKSFLANEENEEQRWRNLGAEFAKDGLSIDRPYLNAGSIDVYEF